MANTPLTAVLAAASIAAIGIVAHAIEIPAAAPTTYTRVTIEPMPAPEPLPVPDVDPEPRVMPAPAE